MAGEGRVALVTGAQQGIGHATALALARAGLDVALNYLDNRACEGSRAVGACTVIPGTVRGRSA